MPSWSERALAAKLPGEEAAAARHVVVPTTSRPAVENKPAAADGFAPFPSPLAYPPEWLQGVELAERASPPRRVSLEGWRLWCSDARAFLDAWGERAHSLGWPAMDLFGVHPTRPRERIDAAGLVPSLGGRQVLALSEGAAAIATAGGGGLTFRRLSSVGGPRELFWALGKLKKM